MVDAVGVVGVGNVAHVGDVVGVVDVVDVVDVVGVVDAVDVVADVVDLVVVVGLVDVVDVTDAADVDTGVTITIDASGVAFSTIDITHVILGDDVPPHVQCEIVRRIFCDIIDIESTLCVSKCELSIMWFTRTGNRSVVNHRHILLWVLQHETYVECRTRIIIRETYDSIVDDHIFRVYGIRVAGDK